MTGDYEKVIFSRDGDAAIPELPARRLQWKTAVDDPTAFREALRRVIAGSLDRHDAWATATNGIDAVAKSYLSPDEHHFVRDPRIWETAWLEGSLIGLVQPLLYVDGERGLRRQATIGYIGVVPTWRGAGYIVDLLFRATVLLYERNVWRIFCDTDTQNHPMIAAFEKLGYVRGKVRSVSLKGWH